MEVNNTFYNLPAAETFRRWGEETPADFRFVLKLSRYLTHIRRLREPDDSVRLFLERAAAAGSQDRARSCSSCRRRCAATSSGSTPR